MQKLFLVITFSRFGATYNKFGENYSKFGDDLFYLVMPNNNFGDK